MMNIEKLSKVKKIFVHGSCHDGTTAAFITKRAFKLLGLELPKIYFIQYGQQKHFDLRPEENQMFIDITPPTARWEEWKEFFPIVLDHHEAAIEATLGLDGVYGGKEDSGAALAFKHIYKLAFESKIGDSVMNDENKSIYTEFHELREISEKVSTYDNWKTADKDKFDEAALVVNAINFIGSKELLEEADKPGNMDVNFIYRLSLILEDKKEWTIKKYVESAIFEEICGLKVAIFNCTEKAVSESAHELLDNHGADLAIGWFTLFQDDKLCYSISLRTDSKQEGLAKKIAVHRGGGGHPNAAGFRYNFDSKNFSHANLLKLIEFSIKTTYS